MYLAKVFIIAVLTAFALPMSAFAKSTLAEAYVESAQQYLEDNNALEAERLFQLAIEEAEEADSMDILPTALLGAGESAYELGKLDQACELFRKCLRVQDSLDDEDESSIRVLAINGLGLAHAHQGKHLEAEALGQKAVAMLQAAGRTEEHLMASVLNNLSIVKIALGKHEEAETLAGKALLVLDAQADEDSPHHHHVHDTLALIYHATGKHEEAEALAEKAVAFATKSHGASSPQVTAKLLTLGLIQKSQERHADCEQTLRTALDICSKSGTSSHPEHRRVHEQLTKLLQEHKHSTEVTETTRPAESPQSPAPDDDQSP